jgi:hypothetical protein
VIAEPWGVSAVLERTDWNALKAQKADLLAAMDYAAQLKRPRTLDGLQGLLNWLDALQDAAVIDGYPVRFVESEEEPR